MSELTYCDFLTSRSSGHAAYLCVRAATMIIISVKKVTYERNY